MKPFPFMPIGADRLPAPSAQRRGVTAICLFALALSATLQASGTIDVPNGGFDTATGNQADYWSTSGNPPGALPGDMRGGSDGGYGWTADYFAGDQPTGKTFASTVNGPVRQDLITTFEAGTEYTLSMQIFSAGNYSPSQDGAILWSLALTALDPRDQSVRVVAIDHWFSDELGSSTVGAGLGGTIPDDHIISVSAASDGLTTVWITYTAQAADHGKRIGIQLAGNTLERYTLAAGTPAPSQYYGMMDSVTLRAGIANPPVFREQPLDIRVAVVGQPVTFSIMLDGPADIQWTRTANGITADLPGANDRVLTFTAALEDADTTYAARVSNAVGTVTSRDAWLQEVDPIGADQLTRGFLKLEHYGGIPGVSVHPDLYAAPSYVAGTPDYTTYTPGVSAPQTSPNLSNFGRVLTGWVQPPSTGIWRFFLRSDDGSELHVSTTQDIILDPEMVTPAAEVGEPCCEPFQEPDAQESRTSGPFSLNANQRYGITVLYKEGGGSDYVYVTWRLDGQTTPAAADLPPINPQHVWTMANPSGKRYDIVRQPASVTAVEDQTATFSIAMDVYPADAPFAIQWRRDGVDLPGATSASYRTPPLSVATDDGAKFSALIYTLRGEILTAEAILTVVADTFPPVPFAGAIVNRDGTSVDIGVSFDEPVTEATAGEQANYSVTAGTVQSFTYHPKSRSALIRVTGLAPGDNGTVTVRNVADPAGNAISADGVQVRFQVSEAFRWDIVGDPTTVVPGTDWGTFPLDGNWVVPVGDKGFDLYSNTRTYWDNYDEGVFVYEMVTGDFDKKLRVEYQDNSSQWAGAGLLMREIPNFGDDVNAQRGSAPWGNDLNPNPDGLASRYQMVQVNPVGPTLTGPGTPGNASWETPNRLVQGGPSSSAGSGGTPLYPDAWCRLQRSGETINIYRSNDGMNWVLIGWSTLSELPETLYVGPSFSPATRYITHPTDRATFLAKIRDYGDTFPAVPEVPALDAEMLPDGTLRIAFDGTLQSRLASGGDWNDTGHASPVTVTPSGEGKLYRAVQ